MVKSTLIPDNAARTILIVLDPHQPVRISAMRHVDDL